VLYECQSLKPVFFNQTQNLYPVTHPEIPIGYDRNFRLKSGIPIGIVYRISHRKSDRILFPINFLIEFFSDRISRRIFVHFLIGSYRFSIKFLIGNSSGILGWRATTENPGWSVLMKSSFVFSQSLFSQRACMTALLN